MKKKLGGIFAALLLVAFGAGVIRATNEEYNQPWRAPDDAKKVRNPIALTSKGLMVASELYEQKCVVCHGPTGGGDGPAAQTLTRKPADFTDARRMSKVTDGELFWKVSTGHGDMPAWQAGLSDNERWLIVSYLRVLTTYGLYRYLGTPLPNR
jgi:mono/diheme cytochrome c family protein